MESYALRMEELRFLILFCTVHVFHPFPFLVFRCFHILFGSFTFIFLPIVLIIILSISGIRKTETLRIAGVVSVVILASYLIFMVFLTYSTYEHYNAGYIYFRKLEGLNMWN